MTDIQQAKQFLEQELFSRHALRKGAFKKLTQSTLEILKGDKDGGATFILGTVKSSLQRHLLEPAREYFIKYFNFLRQFISLVAKEKKEEVKNQYFELALLFTKKYVSIHFDEKMKKKYENLARVFAEVPTEALVARYLNCKSKREENLLIYLIVEKRGRGVDIQTKLLEKLEAQFFIDLKKQEAGGFKFNKLLANAFSIELIRDKMLPLCQKLIRRSDTNLKILLQTSLANVDYSEIAEEVLLKNINDIYESKEESKVAFALAARMSSRSFKPEVQRILFNGFCQKLVAQKFEEKQFEYFAVLAALAQATQKQNDALVSEILTFLISQCSCITQESEYLKLDGLIKKIFENVSDEFKLQNIDCISQNIPKLKSKKYAAVTICRIFSLYLQHRTSHSEVLPINEEESKKISGVADQIFKEFFQTNLKESKKLVTNSYIFVASLEACTWAFSFNEKLQEQVFSTLPQVLSASLYVNTKDFFTKNPTQELTLYLKALVHIFYCFFNDEEGEGKWKVDAESRKVLQFCMVYLVLSSKVCSREIAAIFAKQSVALFNSLTEGLFAYFYLVYAKELEHYPLTLQKTNKFMEQVLLAKQLSAFCEGEENEQKQKIAQIKEIAHFNYLIFNHELVSKKQLISKYQKLVKDRSPLFLHNFEQTSASSVFTAHLLNSQMFVQSKSETVRQGAQGIALYLMNLGQFSLFKAYNIFLQKENQKAENSDKLDEFLEQVETEESQFQSATLQPFKLTLRSMGILQLGAAEEAEIQQQASSKNAAATKKTTATKKPAGKPAPAASKAKSAAGKTNTSAGIPKTKEEFIMLDEEELLAKKLKEHKIAMLQQYQWSMKILDLIGVCTHEAASKYFFEELCAHFISLCEEQPFQPLFKRLMVKLFAQIKAGSFNAFRESLAEFTIKFCENEVPKDKINDQFLLFQDQLNAYNKELPDFLVLFLHQLQKFIVSRQGFDIQLKRAAMQFYCKLDVAKYASFFQEIFEPLATNLNVLSQNQVTYDLLDKSLKNLQNNDQISLLFSDILNNMDRAKIIVLKALYSNFQLLNFQPTFDDIIKLRILIIDENPEISALAEKTLENFPHQINITKINGFDLETFVFKHSKENTEKFTRFAKEMITQNADLSKVFFKKVCSSSSALYTNEEISEESLLFFPHFLQENMDFISGDQFEAIFTTLVEKYTLDGKDMVSSQSLQIGIEVIQYHGPKYSSHIISILEKFLKSPNDQHQLSCIIFLGVIAPYIKNKSAVEGVSQKITDLFSKGSENMQRNLARCMPELINFFDNPKKLAITQLNDLCFHTNSNMKRGYSYLIAGLNKGLGIEGISDLKIFEILSTNADLKKDKATKESTLYLIQAYLDTFGRVIEPYIIRIAEIVMLFFTDKSEEIRDLALNTIKVMMTKLTAFGVKIVLPQMLKGLEEHQWQAKVNNIWSLGNMAYCSAKQLSQCLPQIVPKLSYCLTDTHPSIREASNEALNNIGSTIQNPEISEIVDILIQALSDPYEKNKQGLKVLLETNFEHYIDAPSLSLVIPILDYAMKQKRDPDAKIDACQVIGSISALIKDISDLLPYMDILIEGIQSALADPDSDVRTFGAKAVGKLAQKLGVVNSEKYFKFITETIERESTPSIERGGAASAQAEIMCCLDQTYFQSKLNDIFIKIRDKRAHMQEGYIGLFVYLPNILKDKFQKYIKSLLENIVEFVTHDSEKVREVSLRVLKILIQNYGITDTELLMMPINEGMFSSNWRKRNSALILSEQMLEVLSKFIKVPEGEEMTEEQLEKQIERNKNIMGVYIMRFDEMDQIRNCATNIWKVFIENTPKTMKMALNYFLDKLCESIINSNKDISNTTTRCLREFSVKYGESFYPQIMSEVLKKFESEKENIDYITGLVLVLRIIMIETNGPVVGRYKEEYITLVKLYLFTQDRRLREAIFSFYRVVVEKISTSSDKYVMDQVVDLTYKDFKKLDSETSADYNIYLEIFNQLFNQRSQRLMQYMIPFLFQAPIQMQQIDIVTNNAELIGAEVYNLVKAQNLVIEGSGGCEIMMEEAFLTADENLLASMQYCLEQLAVNLTEEDMRKFFNYMMVKLRAFSNKLADSQKEIKIILSVLDFYYFNSANRIHDFNDDIVQMLVPKLFLDTAKYHTITLKSVQIFKSFFGAINRKVHFDLLPHTVLAIAQRVEKEIEVQQIKEDGEFLINGFNIGELGQGIAPYIDMIISCLVYNSHSEFDKALVLVELIVKHTSVAHLNAHIMKIVGPLIRVINYKYEQDRKEKIISILNLIQQKNMNIDMFSTQLQSTYLKLVQEFPRDLEFLKLLSCNLVGLLQYTNKKDVFLHDVHHRFKVENNQVVKEAYLFVLEKYIKSDVVEGKKLFARALLEKLFANFTQILQKENLSNNILFYLSKLIGYLSFHTHLNGLHKYQAEVKGILEDGAETPHNIFFATANLMAIFLYNPHLGNQVHDVEDWKLFKPIENFQTLLQQNLNKFEKEWVHFIMALIRKSIKKQTEMGKFLQSELNFKNLLNAIDPELMQFQDTVNLFKPM